MARITKIAIVSTALLSLTSMAQAETTEPVVSPTKEGTATTSAAGDSVPAGLVQLLPTSQIYSPYAFVVDKKARMLSVWQQTTSGLKKIASFPADLGKNAGDKRFRNDAKTPEGIYFLRDRLEGPGLDFSLYGKRAFVTNYPNYFDRLDGKTGSGIWLHAVPDTVPLTRGSRGCVVVRNNVILDLTKYVKLGRTPILIQNKLQLVPPQELEKQTSELNQWLESWRTAWEKKDIEAYINHYASEFHSMHMNREAWRAYKERLNEQYKTISIKISKPSILGDRDRAIVRFIQEYISDQHSDFGEKTLYLKRGDDGFRIIGEDWAPESSQLAREELEAATKSSVCEEGAPGCIRTNAGVQ